MHTNRIRAAIIALTASVALSGCAGYYGNGMYGGVSAGYGDGYYGNGYRSGYYGGYGYPSGYGYGYGYGSYGSPFGAYGGFGYPSYYGGFGYPSYYGWYNNFYYPGTGIYVYSRSGDRHRWSDSQRRYWESRRSPRNTGTRENWTAYRSTGTPTAINRQVRVVRPVEVTRDTSRTRPARSTRVTRTVRESGDWDSPQPSSERRRSRRDR